MSVEDSILTCKQIYAIVCVGESKIYSFSLCGKKAVISIGIRN